MSVLSRRCRHLLLILLATAPLMAVRTAHAQLARVEGDGRVWGVQFRLTDVDDEPLAPVIPADDPADDPFTDDQLAPIFDIDQLADFAPDPMAPVSPWLATLEEGLPPPATVVVAAAVEAPAIEATQLVRQSRAATSISGIRRSPVSLQPVIRGYQQQSIHAQYQGAKFVPVRFDLDSILTNIDPSLIDNLIIIPGPYGVRYGPGLAFIDVQAKPLPRFAVPTLKGRTSLLVQSNGSQFYGHQVLSGGGLNYGYRAVYNDKVGSDYTSGNGTRIPSAYNLRDVDFAIAWDPNDSSTIQFEYLRQDMSNARFAGLVFDVGFRKTDAFFLRFANDEGWGGSEWLADAWWNRTKMAGNNFDDVRRRFFENFPPFDKYSDYIGFTDADVTSLGCRVAPTWGDGEQARFTAGVDIRYFEQELNEYDNFRGEDSRGDRYFVINPILPSSMLDVGAFAEWTTAVHSNWQVTIGVRADWLRTQRREHDGNFHFFPDFDFSYTQQVFPEAFEIENLLYHAFVSADREITHGLSIRLGFGHGERPPDLTERFAYNPFLNLVQSPTSAAVGDEDLKPEAASQFDIAMIGDCDAIRFQIMGFVSFIDEHITLRSGPPSGLNPLPTLVFSNYDSVLTGAECSIEYDWTPSLMPFAKLRYVTGRNLERGEPLPRIFPMDSRVGIRWRDSRRNRYGAEFTARIVDRQDRVAASLGELPTAGFATFDLRGFWQAAENLRFTSGFENFANRNYLEHFNVHVPSVLEPGLNFYFTAQCDY